MPKPTPKQQRNALARPQIRERWKAGDYDLANGAKPRTDYVTGWRNLAGRSNHA